MTQLRNDPSAIRRKLARAFGLAAAMVSFPALATTWDRLPIEKVYAAADTVAYIEVESAAIVRDGRFSCGARYVATTVMQLKGKPASTVTFFGPSGIGAPAVGGEYLVFLTQSDLSGLGMMSTNSYSMQAAAEFRRRCGPLLPGFKPIDVYGLIEANWNLVTDGIAFKVQERHLLFPDSITRAGDDGDFGDVDRLYDSRWYPIDPVLKHLRSLQLSAEPGAIVRRNFLHYRDLAEMVLNDPSILEELVGSAEMESGPEYEELLELAGRIASTDPKAYLKANRKNETCFGISTPSWRAAEDQVWEDERQKRRDALAGVHDPRLAKVRRRCLEQLDGAGHPSQELNE